jgi:hypothetical protein
MKKHVVHDHNLELLKYVMHKSALENNTNKHQKTKHKAIVTPSTIISVFLKCEAKIRLLINNNWIVSNT